MKTNFSKQRLNEEDQRAVRLVRGLRAVAGVVIVGVIYLAIVVSMVPNLFDQSTESVMTTEPSHPPELPPAALRPS